MNRFLGLFLCTLSLATLLLPLPILHFHGGEDFHIGAVALHGDEADTCELNEDAHHKSPPKACAVKHKKSLLWVAHAPQTTAVHALPVPGFPPVTAPEAVLERPAPRPVNRGPPRSILALYCTLRV
jgi:hypothetical protein